MWKNKLRDSSSPRHDIAAEKGPRFYLENIDFYYRQVVNKLRTGVLASDQPSHPLVTRGPFRVL